MTAPYRFLAAGLLVLTPILNTAPAEARYNSGTYGRICDKHMERIATTESLERQLRFAKKCFVKIKEESGRYHDAYMIWMSNIYSSQANYDEAFDWSWHAINSLITNNRLDGRSPNDFMSTAFMSLLMQATDGIRTTEWADEFGQDNAKTLADLSTAVIKVAGCNNAKNVNFYRNQRGILYSDSHGIDLNFNIKDTTLSKEEQLSHCAFASVMNLFARMSITDNSDYINACAKARSVMKFMSDEKYKGLKDSVGNIYQKMTERLSDGRCTAI